MREVDFRLPLSGSLLFDSYQKAIVHVLLLKFPEINEEVNETSIRLTGELNEERYHDWIETVYKKPIL